MPLYVNVQMLNDDLLTTMLQTELNLVGLRHQFLRTGITSFDPSETRHPLVAKSTDLKNLK